MSTSLCWICGHNPAETSEHWAKRANVRTYFGEPTQSTPLYLARDWKPYTTIGGTKSKHLKFAPSMCGHCNNVRTQPYDYAWDTLFEYLHKHWRQIKASGRFDLHKVFRNDPLTGAKNVQLFFVKLFGCLVNEEKIPIDLAGMARALYFDTVHPDISLAVAHDDQTPLSRKRALRDRVHTWGSDLGWIEGTIWLYLFSPVGVKVLWRRPRTQLRPDDVVWHPSDGRRHIRVNEGL